MNQEEYNHYWHLDLVLLSLWNYENYIFLLFISHSVCGIVIALQTDQGREAQCDGIDHAKENLEGGIVNQADF